LARTSNNQQLISEAKQELTTSLGLVEIDIEDLEDSVTAVEESGTWWGLSYEEVQSRRRALEDVKADVKVCSAELAVARLAHYMSSIALLQKMLQSITDDQSSPSTLAPNQTNGKHRGSDPFSDVELGHASNTGSRPRNDNNAYSDDPYAERRSDEVDDYEMEQQQVRHSHRKTRERLTGAAW
jgi:hypothetical protein